MNKIIIYQAVPEDAKDIRKVQKETWLCTYPNEKLGITKADIEEKVDEMQARGIDRLVERIENDKDSRTFVAKDGDHVVGFIGVQKTEDRNRLRALYVLSGYQGQGIGRRLMEESLEFLGTDKKITLEVVEYNTKAIEFYKNFGFIENGLTTSEAAKLLNGKEMPEIEMVKLFT